MYQFATICLLWRVTCLLMTKSMLVAILWPSYDLDFVPCANGKVGHIYTHFPTDMSKKQYG